MGAGCSSWVLPTVRAAGLDGWGLSVPDGTLVSAGLFVDVDRDGGIRTAILAGTDGEYRGALPASAAAAAVLSGAVTAELDRRGSAADFGPLGAAVTAAALVERSPGRVGGDSARASRSDDGCT